MGPGPLARHPRYPPPVRRAALSLFALLAGVYVLLTGGHVYSPDTTLMVGVSRAIVERQQLHVPELAESMGFGGSLHEGRFYVKYGLGWSLAAAPGVALGHALAPLSPPGESLIFDTPTTAAGREFFAQQHVDPSGATPYRRLWYETRDFTPAFATWCASLTNAWVTAAAMVAMLLAALSLGAGLRAALPVVLLVALATPVAHYARTAFSEPLVGLGLAGCLAAALRARDRPALWFVAGLFLGTAVLTRVGTVVQAPLALLLWDRRASSLARATAGFVLPVGVALAYNAVRFGNPLETGYAGEVGSFSTPFLEGLRGLWTSPGRGLLLYCPLVVPALFGLRRLPRAVALYVAGSLVGLTLLYAKWHMWEGGWCWGPRFLVPALPLLALGLLHVRPLVIAPFALASAAIVAPSHVVHWHDYYQWLKRVALGAPELLPPFDHYYDLLRWHLDYAPLTRFWQFPVRDGLLLPHALETPGLVLALLGVAAVVALGGAVGLVRAWHAASGVDSPRHNPQDGAVHG